MIAGTPSAVLDAFAHRTLDLIHGVVPLSASAFHLRPEMPGFRCSVLHGIDPATDASYHRQFSAIDPIQPPLFEGTPETVVPLASLISAQALHQSEFYRGFMVPNGYRHVADMFLRRDGSIVAVVSLLRCRDKPAFDNVEVAVLKQLQCYIEYTLCGITGAGLSFDRENLRRALPFTERELDVVELVLQGYSNKAIQRALGISLATVKTHLLRIFDKSGVSSRAELITRLLRPH